MSTRDRVPEAGDLYGAALNRLIFPVWESAIKRRPTLKLLSYLEEAQWRSLDEIEARQAGDLRRVLRHAATHVPLYRRRFAAAGLGPDDIASPADLLRLPLLTRDQAIDTMAERESEAPPLCTLRKSTGGTTGQPMRFGYDARSEDWRQAVKLRGWGWGGYRTGARVLYYWGAPAKPPLKARLKVELDRALKRERYVDCNVRGPAELAEVARIIERTRPEVLILFTQAGVDLARWVLDNGGPRWGTIPVLCCAEKLFPDDRPLLVEAFGPAVFETYGCREVMLIGHECAAHDGLHLSSENLVVELLVREPGGDRHARPGEVGEVVLTDLHNFGMPFIRYLNGDLAVAGPRERCACGRALPRLASVDGRVAETLRDARGARVNGLMFNVVFTPLAAEVRQFQAVQHPGGAVTLKVVPTTAGQTVKPETMALIKERCEKALQGVVVTPVQVDDIPLGKNGKRRVVIHEA